MAGLEAATMPDQGGGAGRLPDFIIAGAPRSATSWLYQLADRHPEIHMAKPMRPEPKFFLVDELYERGPAYYSQTWFADVPARQLCGEKSTNYLESPVAATRIHANVPEVKLIFVLRDPIERAYSNFRWSRQNGMEHETNFAAALGLEEGRERTLPHHLRFARPFAYFSRGLYADLLMSYFDLFPRQAILIIRHEDIETTPTAVAARLHGFLGIALRPSDAADHPAVNATTDNGADPLSQEVRDMLAVRYSEPNARLSRLLGPDFSLWNS
jgi:hypothetical protein